MKKVSSFCMVAALCAAFTFGAAGPALSAVFTPAAQDPVHGFPKWYTDPVNATPPPVGGMSLVPCLSQTISPDPNAAGGFMCVLLPDVGFDPNNAIVFPNNFPPEFFYYIADARILNLGAVQGDRADYRAALEGTFGNGTPAAGQQISFTRVRFTVDAAVNGDYRITHPFGQRTFLGVVAGQAAIDVQEDIGNEVAPGGPFLPITTPVGAASQAGGGLQQFLVRAVAGVPAPITVGSELFIGDPNVDQTVVGATQPDPAIPAQPFNAFMVERDTGAGFVQIGRTDNFALAGQIIALTLTPPAQGTDFGVWKLNSASTRKTFQLQNLSPNLITPVIAAIVPNSNPAVPSPDFSIAASAVAPCLGSVATGSTCNFDVIFNTATSGAKNATITINGGVDVPPVQTTVTGTGDGIPPDLAVGQNVFTNSLSALISGTATDNINVHDINVSLGGVSQGTSTVTNGAWSFIVSGLTLNAPNTVTVTANDTALPFPGNTTTLTTTVTHDNVLPVVSLTAPVDALLINKPALQALTFTATDLNLAATVFKVDGAIVTPTPANLGALTDGAHTVSVEATDSAGNISVATNSITVALTNGDIDGSGTVTIADALQALRVTVDLAPQPAPNTAPLYHGDVAPLGSPNGTIDIADALLILRNIVGLVTF